MQSTRQEMWKVLWTLCYESENHFFFFTEIVCSDWLSILPFTPLGYNGHFCVVKLITSLSLSGVWSASRSATRHRTTHLKPLYNRTNLQGTCPEAKKYWNIPRMFQESRFVIRIISSPNKHCYDMDQTTITRSLLVYYSPRGCLELRSDPVFQCRAECLLCS